MENYSIVKTNLEIVPMLRIKTELDTRRDSFPFPTKE